MGSVSGADADGRAMNIFGSLSFFGVRPHKPPLRACFMLTDRQSEGGQQAGIPLLEARVSGGRYHDREEQPAI